MMEERLIIHKYSQRTNDKLQRGYCGAKQFKDEYEGLHFTTRWEGTTCLKCLEWRGVDSRYSTKETVDKKEHSVFTSGPLPL